MKLSVRLALLLALIITACAPAAVPVAAPATDEPADLQTETATTPAERSAAPAVAPVAKEHNVSYRGFRFRFDDTLASTAAGGAVDALVGDANHLDIPEHVRFTFDGQAPAKSFNPSEPQLLIYPARAYVNISPAAAIQVGALQSLITDRSAPAQGPLPLLPVTVDAETLHGQLRFLSFQGGQGARYIARYGASQDLFYTFQGLSEDGDYYIAFFYPVSAAALAAAPAGTPSGAGAAESTDAGLLKQLTATDFAPNLVWLDALVSTLALPESDPGLSQSQPPKAVLDTLRSQGYPGLQALWDTLKLGEQNLFDPQTQLNADLFELDVNNNKDEYQILVISDENHQNWQYLLFRAVGIRWWFSGYINLPFQAFVPPSYNIEGDGQDAWLVVDWLALSGAGITRYEEGWFLLSRGQLSQALKYPAEGYQTSQDGPYNVCYRVSPEVLDGMDGFGLRLPFSIGYSIYGDGKDSTNLTETYDLFSMEREMLYRWNPDTIQFEVDPSGSNVSPEQVEADFYLSGADGDLVLFAQQELEALAQSGGGLQKRWLKQYLSGLESSPEVENLLNAMGG